MADQNNQYISTSQKKGVSIGAVVLISLLTAFIAVWVTLSWLFPRPFTPVVLTGKEQTVLQTKVSNLHLDLQASPQIKGHSHQGQDRILEPQKYTEVGAPHEITFTEREVNALLANNTDLASRVAIDLSPGLVSIRALLPVDPDMPLLGGKTLKISAGVALGYKNSRPMVILRGVSLWGVPIPNAWLGDLKNVDLVHEFGNEGFWKDFAAGVDNISVGDAVLSVRLKQ